MIGTVRVAAAELRVGDTLPDLSRDRVPIGDAVVQYVGRAMNPLVGEVCVIRCHPAQNTDGSLILTMPPDQAVEIRPRKAG